MSKSNKEEYYNISPTGLAKLASVFDPNDSQKNTNWTLDYTMELPITMQRTGPASETPITLIEMWQDKLKVQATQPALNVKRNKKWQTWTFQQYYDDACYFAKALLALEIKEYSAVNIIGFNSPEWMITFYGSIFGYYLPVGIYTTNLPEACFYVSDHSECEVVVLEDKEQLQKYLQIWDRLPKLKAIIVYNDPTAQTIVPPNRRHQVYQWKEIMDLGLKYRSKNEENSLENRMKKQKPGNCCTLVYTSGTTGPPKGVMLSHDSNISNYLDYIYVAKNIIDNRPIGNRLVSFLPISHVVAQLIDIVMAVMHNVQVFYAEPDALQGSLVETLKEVRPTIFFTVPRIWEKMEEKMKQIMSLNGFPKKQITDWAMGVGKTGTFAETHNQSKPLCFGLAKKMVYDKIKMNLGLDQVSWFVYGAAPMQPQTREFFLSLNIFLINGFGMSESTGAHSLSFPENFDKYDDHFIRSTGRAMNGAEIKIHNPDKDGEGEICFRGRNVFMGYYKNEQATRETIDENRYLHTGDLGRLDSKGNLKITGRLKELIVTAGGENVAPVLIENEIIKALPIISNCMVIGDLKKYLSVILTFKLALDKNGKITDKLAPEVIAYLAPKGSKATTPAEAKGDKIVLDILQKGIDQANKFSVSKAAFVRKFAIIEGDFTQDGGELTPTLKLKRKVTYQKYESIIDTLYQDAKL